MNANGVLGSMCFPSFPQFCGQLFARTEDKDVALAMLRAYNDWHIDEWCGTLPGPVHPAARSRRSGTRELMADEVRRVAAEGLPRGHVLREPREARLAELPHATTGTRSGRRAATRARSSACTSARRRSSSITALDAPIDVLITLQPMNIVQAAADLLWSPVLRKFPDLKRRAVRGRHRLDPVLPRAPRLHLRAATTRGPARTSATSCRARCSASASSPASSTTRSASTAASTLGIDHDHVGVRLPALRLDLAERARDAGAVASTACRDDEIDKITHLNAMRHFRYDPFTALGGKENCTVGALRAEAVGHDVSIVPRAKDGAPASRTKAADLAGHGDGHPPLAADGSVASAPSRTSWSTRSPASTPSTPPPSTCAPPRPSASTPSCGSAWPTSGAVPMAVGRGRRRLGRVVPRPGPGGRAAGPRSWPRRRSSRRRSRPGCWPGSVTSARRAAGRRPRPASG